MLGSIRKANTPLAAARSLGVAMLLLALTGLTATAADTRPEPGEEGIAGALAAGFAPPKLAPPRGDEARGPFDRLVIQNAMLVVGNGAPPQGPVTIEVRGDRIYSIDGGHASDAELAGAEVIDVAGGYVLPGFVDAHTHLGTPGHAQAGALTDSEYVLKLWLAHGVTTVRDVGAVMGLGWTLKHREMAAAGEISAPRMRVHAMFPPSTATADEARDWVKAVRKRGADGVKFRGARAEPFAAAMEEAKRLGMKTSYHHAQLSVVQTNVLDSARLGLDSMEHWYGLPEAMFEDRVIQNYPHDYNYSNEQDRFGEAGRLWMQAAAPGSETWQRTIAELVDLDFTLSPTFTIYEANRDLMRARNADWMDEYVPTYMARAFEADPDIHGSYFFDWTTQREIDWKQNFQRWMQFVNDYKNAGGRVVAGSDAGFIYKVYGFAYIREFELLQEAGFHPLEVIKAATLDGAELLGLDRDIGSVEVGKKADLVIMDENPLANFKLLYGTGHRRLNRDTGLVEQVGGVRYTVRDGIVFDAKMLLEDVRALVAAEKAEP
ncbi:MAG: amidohydrolase family protein [Congregibacter sp.]|nr:amidohydrolase family protein [Congregibacter sp.]MDP5071559.1 amidohydrolase family protein [Congregibacter sp.]